MCVRLGQRALALWQTEQLLSSHIASAASSSGSSGLESYTEELVAVREIHNICIHIMYTLNKYTFIRERFDRVAGQNKVKMSLRF